MNWARQLWHPLNGIIPYGGSRRNTQVTSLPLIGMVAALAPFDPEWYGGSRRTTRRALHEPNQCSLCDVNKFHDVSCCCR